MAKVLSVLASRISRSVVIALVAATALGSPLIGRAQNASAAAQIKAIDTDCSAIQNAIMALHPVHLALVQSKWKVLSDADYAVAERTHASITLVDAWKAENNYAWIHSHSFDAQGNQRATQLCFRQSNGSLERARQATTVPDLSSASAKEGYFASDGSLIFAAKAFDQNDPALTKSIKSLPFYSVLP
jgi:hypothetical protein